MTDRTRYEQRLLTQYSVARALANAESFESVAPKILEIVAGLLDWRVGILWTLDEEDRVLRLAAYWDRCSPEHGFAEESRKITFRSGVGLPGRVWSTLAPSFIPDLSQDVNFLRRLIAMKYGFHSAFAFPIMLGGSVQGVMEFYAEHAQTADDELLDMAASLGFQLGEFLERTRAQQRLAEREESYRVLTETASDGIITIDSESRIHLANSAAARIFGYSPAELIGADLTMLMPEEQRAAHKAAMARYLSTGNRSVAWEAFRLVGQHRAGYEIPIEASFGEYRRGQKHFFVVVIRDITERRRLEDSLRQTAKLESLGVLAGGIAHDFNNLLTGILGNVSLALDTTSGTNPARGLLQDAIEATERAADLTRQLLAYAGKGRFVVEATDISTLVHQISALIRSSIPKNVALRLDLEQPLPPVEADAAQLQQLIMNLVINAAEAIPEDRQGSVLVITRAQTAGAEYLETMGITDIPPGNYVSLSVHDNGVGMDDATLGRIFDPFFSTKFLGRGLGLAAVCGIVRGHSGAMKVFSSPGQGTTFRVLLPVTAKPQPRGLPRVQKSDVSGSGTVLVVDDELIVRKMATSCLENYGYDVVSAADGREGVALFEKLHPRIKLVILDLTMPVMGGDEALDLMRSANPEVPVILSSGYNESEATTRFAGKGLAGFLQKPYTAAALAEKVASVVRAVHGFAGGVDGVLEARSSLPDRDRPC
jgi:PAS domain S-box-containing protein